MIDKQTELDMYAVACYVANKIDRSPEWAEVTNSFRPVNFTGPNN